mgnify:CR=1 FL=1
MEVRQLSEQKPFTTRDGSTIRSILDLSNAPVEQQSLAEATIAMGNATERHYHKVSEEFYFLLEGEGVMELDGETRVMQPGDAVVIPAGAWHPLTAEVRFSHYASRPAGDESLAPDCRSSFGVV